MLSFLLPLASSIVHQAVSKLPDNEELGEKLVDICLTILEKAVKLTSTKVDDQLLAAVKLALANKNAPTPPAPAAPAAPAAPSPEA